MRADRLLEDGRTGRRALAAGGGSLESLEGLRPRLLSGHFWTLAGYFRNEYERSRPPDSRPFELTVLDSRVGELELTGRLSDGGGDTLVVILHGIAGSCDSGYAVRAAAAAERVGWSCLRLNMRGADGSGQDLFHAGLTDDLHSVLASAEIGRYRSLHALGFSLGGHVALRAATQEAGARLRSVAAVCSPLDLSACASAFDRPVSWIYRRRILAELSRRYERLAARRSVAVEPGRVHRARTLREFDGLTVAPRFGFDDAEDYYRRMSVGPVLSRLRVPSLLVVGVSDPLVPLATLAPFLSAPPAALTVRYQDPGGHVGFPVAVDLGIDAPPGLESQAIGWLASHSHG